MTIAGKNRQSNIELLRIIAMLMVCILHANFLAVGQPDPTVASDNPLLFVFQHYVEALTIVAVNVFVLISGWFKINPSLKGFFNLMFQVFFFMGGLYGSLLVLGYGNLTLHGIADSILFTESDQFVKAYICLYILSPVLNYYVDNAPRVVQRNVLISFYIYQSSYAFLGGATLFFAHGYGTLSFIGLYLLAQYVKQFHEVDGVLKFFYDKGKLFYLISYIICASVIVFIVYATARYNFKADYVTSRIYAYDNPVVVIEALMLFLLFTKFRFESRIVNYIASFSFATYLLQGVPQARSLFFGSIKQQSIDYGAYSIFTIMFTIVLFYIVSSLLDIVRKFVWSRINNIYNNVRLFKNN